MTLGAQEHFENQVPLGRTLQALLLNVIEKDLLLFSHSNDVKRRILRKTWHSNIPAGGVRRPRGDSGTHASGVLASKIICTPEACVPHARGVRTGQSGLNPKRRVLPRR